MTSMPPRASSWVSRRRRIRRSNQFSSESGSTRWDATLTACGPNSPCTSGAGNCFSSAVEKPAPGSSDHCIGVRTALRPGTSRFSPMPISSP